jgi:hypothetical protein
MVGESMWDMRSSRGWAERARYTAVLATSVFEHLQSQHQQEQTRRERIELCAPGGLPAGGEAGQCARRRLASTLRRAQEQVKASGIEWDGHSASLLLW